MEREGKITTRAVEEERRRNKAGVGVERDEESSVGA